MEKRRITRNRPRRGESANEAITTNTTTTTTATASSKRNAAPSASAPAASSHSLNLRSSPSRLRNSSPARARPASPPVRRSSRPRSSASSATITITPIVPPSPIKELKEPKPSPKTNATPTTNTRNATVKKTPPSVPITTTTTKSLIQSSYTATTEETLEIRTSTTGFNPELGKISEFIRRSMSKNLNGRENSHTPTTNTEPDTRYSRSLSRSVYDDDNYSKTEFSETEGEKLNDDDEDDNDAHYKSFNASTAARLNTSSAAILCRKLEAPREFGGCLGTVLLLALAPCFVYYLQWCCGKTACDFKVPKLGAVFNLQYLMRNVFQTEAVVAYLSGNMAVFLLSALLPGKRVQLPAGAERGVANYLFNVLPMAVLLNIGAGVAIYFKIPLVEFVLRHHLRFCLYGILNAYIVAWWAYARGNLLRLALQDNAQANIYGKTGNALIDYAQGRQINPKWLNRVDFKQVFYRISLLTTLLYAECLVYKSVQLPSLPPLPADVFSVEGMEATWQLWRTYCGAITYDPIAFFSAGMLLLYIVDAIVFEHHLASSFELQGEGFGCLLLLRYAVTPYLLSAVARYFQTQNIAQVECKFAIYVPLVLLLSGLVLKRFSNAVKYKYRVNPYNPFFHGIDTIHTFQGRRLLLGGLWGRLRQPNYAGDILALIALALPMYLCFAWPPVLSVSLCIVLLLHRTVRVQTRNLARYHSSWVRYCNQVRNYILPKVY